MGCSADALCLVSNTYSAGQIRDMILGSDIVYVGGGDTVRMLETWRG
ncbi:peptidase E [Thermoclostridium stercorarium]|nr:Type 1 glutamine amidotransferase-like domain-containing protein [Thermoclostridium stercorarium]UZQ86992.1 peptidase E [Thermoclostridium stercorarium]